MQTVLAGQANILELPIVAKSNGGPITSGVVNFYVVDKDGANAGEWYRGSDTSWQVAESIAGAATHRADGHWYLSVPSAVWTRDIRYRLYGKESGNLHIPVGEDIIVSISEGGGSLILWAGEAGNFREDGIVHFYWNSIDQAGSPISPSTAGSICIYKDDGTSKVTAPTGITDTRNFNGITGLHECKIDTNANIFYARSKSYNVILEGAVIDTKAINIKLASFSVEDRFVQEFIR